MDSSSRRLLIIGCGSVSQCTLPLLIDYYLSKGLVKSISIIDAIDRRTRINNYLQNNSEVFYQIECITPDNYGDILVKYLSSGDILIDLAFNLETRCLLRWCHDHHVRFINTSVELWEPFGEVHRNDPRLLTLYHRQMQLLELQKEANWHKNGPTAILDHGCNPGLVSHFVKRGLRDMCEYVLHHMENGLSTEERMKLEEAFQAKDYPQLAYLLDIKTIHISERDTQLSTIPKQVNEFVNTWSIDGLAEEAIAPAELGWGTHERDILDGTYFHDEKQGPCNQICLKSKGMNTWVFLIVFSLKSKRFSSDDLTLS